MKLISVLTKDYDVYDRTYDIGTCFCALSNLSNDLTQPYEMFIQKLSNHLEIIRISNGDSLIVDFVKLINDNKALFIAFMNEYWVTIYEDDESFKCAWINELCAYVNGYISDDIYRRLCDLLDNCT